MHSLLVIVLLVGALFLATRYYRMRSTAQRRASTPRVPRDAEVEVLDDETEELAERATEGDWAAASSRDDTPQAEAASGASDSDPPAEAVGAAPDPDPPAKAREQLYAIAQELLALYQQLSQPSELLGHDVFRQGLGVVVEVAPSGRALLGYFTGENLPVALLALEALAQRREKEPVDPDHLRRLILQHISEVHPWTRFFALRALDARVKEPIVADLLLSLEPGWEEMPLALDALRGFVERRKEREEIAFGTRLEGIREERAQFLHRLLGRIGTETAARLADELEQGASQALDLGFLSTLGRIWTPSESVIVRHAGRERLVESLRSQLTGTAPRPQILVGEPGVGKTTLLRRLSDQLLADGWIVFEAGASELVAGQRYLGDLENRLRELVERVEEPRRVVWIIPALGPLVRGGTHEHSRTGLLHMLLPYLTEGRIRVIAEASPAGLDQASTAEPAVSSIFDIHRIEPLDAAATRQLADTWAGTMEERGWSLESGTVDECSKLAEQYLPHMARPGNVLQLLEGTAARVEGASKNGPRRLGTEQVLELLSKRTGLPLAVLDDRERLDLARLRAFFDARVIAQSEAVDCLVKRIAMIKAGVTDPTRPLGVFLFAGPTGTGKTELAKATAEYLFGSSDRMIRLDMTEFQTADSLGRLLGRSAERRGGSLVERIREQPFSLLLLDEFEKASPPVWDLFLQLFDDGRLTDWSGNTSDFRNTIVIMTSNLGAALPERTRLGFSPDSEGFRAESVERVIEQTFRPEFLNRIDQVVVFRPLSRAVMRQLLEKELAEVTQRRGLRNRQWAIEWEESALEFLLDRGFTESLGARPLKRAIERHLLAPLAETIVQHEYPAGDQFLFVRGDGDALRVDFVDPDVSDQDLREAAVSAAGAPAGAFSEGERAAAGARAPGDSAASGDEALPSLASIVLDGHGTREEVQLLRATHARLQRELEEEGWRERKAEGLQAISRPGFWESDERFEVLGRTEFIDRVETGLETAGSLLRRLLRSSSPATPRRERFPSDLVRRLALKLYLLETALEGLREGSPRDAYLLVEGSRDPQAPERAREFAQRLGAMYLRWGKKRGMRVTLLEETENRSRPAVRAEIREDPYRLLLEVSGYGAYSLLRPEDGLHVFEYPGDEDWKSGTRVRTRVRVAPQPDTVPPATGLQRRRERAHNAIGSDENAPAVVRHYREEPSPIVRDSIRGWKTGRLDRVFQGDFDLIA